MMSTKTSDTYESRGLNASAALQVASFTEENKANGMAIDTDIQNNTTGLAGGAGSLNIIFHF